MRGMDRVLVGLIAALAPWMDRSSEDRTAELDARVARLEPALDDKDELVRTASAEAL
jgi:hypothetical protein